MRESVLFDLEHFIIELSGSCLRAARIIIILMMDKLNLITSLTTDWCIDWTGEGHNSGWIIMITVKHNS